MSALIEGRVKDNIDQKTLNSIKLEKAIKE